MPVLYTNGTVMCSPSGAEYRGLLTDGDKIIALGGRDRLCRIAADLASSGGDAPDEVDMRGGCLMPSFIDSHGHLAALASGFLSADLSDCRDTGCLLDAIARQARESGDADAWITGGNLDTALWEGALPGAAALDAAAGGRPVYIRSVTGHSGLFGAQALRRLGDRRGDGDGYREEAEFFALTERVPMPDTAQLCRAAVRAQEVYASYGVTTVQEGMLVPRLIPLYRELTAAGVLKLDVAAYADEKESRGIEEAFGGFSRRYGMHFRLAGRKIFLDGSLQARTAWLREPYLPAGGEGDTTAEYGSRLMSDGEVREAVRRAARDGVQLIAHCNGDAAAAQFTAAVSEVAGESPGTGDTLIRPVMIHAQYPGTELLPAMKKAGIIPSFFIGHVRRWGDAHLRNLGQRRAARISPAGSALRLGMRFTLHQDTPVTPPDMLDSVSCAVNRQTNAGVTLGADEKIPVAAALRAVTLNAAYQYSEENSKGRLAPGMLADMVLLDRDPRGVPPEEIAGVRVMRTVKDGKTVYESGK